MGWFGQEDLAHGVSEELRGVLWCWRRVEWLFWSGSKHVEGCLLVWWRLLLGSDGWEWRVSGFCFGFLNGLEFSAWWKFGWIEGWTFCISYRRPAAQELEIRFGALRSQPKSPRLGAWKHVFHSCQSPTNSSRWSSGCCPGYDLALYSGAWSWSPHHLMNLGGQAEAWILGERSQRYLGRPA